jgi:hypothetical protein
MITMPRFEYGAEAYFAAVVMAAARLANVSASYRRSSVSCVRDVVPACWVA